MQSPPVAARTIALFTLLAGMAAIAAGCSPESRGFVLPKGDVSRGFVVFRELQCNQCHSVPGVIKKRYDSLYPEVEVVLGGPVSRIKTYGELVTAVIHPAKAVTRSVPPEAMLDEQTSIMPNYNGALTVAQLVDLVTFLQETYQLAQPPFTPYPLL